MSSHPFAALAGEYARRLSVMHITMPTRIDVTARKALSFKARYLAISAQCGVPAALIAALHYRESDFDFTTGLGQGDPIDKPSVHLPSGHGPFVSFEEAALFYLHYDHVDDNSQPWSMPYVCWKAESYNGFGPRTHGRTSGYLWSGSDQYTGGKYVADGVWSPSTFDVQLGTIPIIKAMIDLDASLAFGGPGASAQDDAGPPILTPAPGQVGGTDAKMLQRALNILGYGPLLEDGSYGRFTRNAVRAFQSSRGLTVDGLIGPNTLAALTTALTTLKQ